MYESKFATYGIEAVVPSETDQQVILNIIFPNLVAGIVTEHEKAVIFGTAFTMSSKMYESKFEEYGIEAVVPNEVDQQVIHNIIFPNLVAGIVTKHEKATILEIAVRMLSEHNADALVLGCTELPLIIEPNDLNTTILDTTKIHIDAILYQMLG